MQTGTLEVQSCEESPRGSGRQHYVAHVPADNGLVSLVYLGPLRRGAITKRLNQLLRKEGAMLQAGVYWFDDRFVLGHNVMACLQGDVGDAPPPAVAAD